VHANGRRCLTKQVSYSLQRSRSLLIINEATSSGRLSAQRNHGQPDIICVTIKLVFASMVPSSNNYNARGFADTGHPANHARLPRTQRKVGRCIARPGIRIQELAGSIVKESINNAIRRVPRHNLRVAPDPPVLSFACASGARDEYFAAEESSHSIDDLRSEPSIEPPRICSNTEPCLG
jgi:hypothetical protein